MPQSQAEINNLRQYLEPESLTALRGAEPPKCARLRQLRTNAGLTLSSVCTLYGLVQALALFGELTVAEGRGQVDLGGATLSLDMLRAANVQTFLGRVDGLDITHLSKFERGEQIPWTRARVRLTFLFGLVYGKPMEVRDVFPELEKIPGLQQTIRGGS